MLAELFPIESIVYHRWDLATQQRVLAIDRLEWVDGAPVVRGPTSTPQPEPAVPQIAGFASFELAGRYVSVVDDRLVLAPDEGTCAASLALPTDQVLVEVSVQALGANPVGEVGLQLCRGADVLVDLSLVSDATSTILRVNGQLEQVLPVGFDLSVLHLLRLDSDGEQATLRVDAHTARATVALGARPTHLCLTAGGSRAAFVGFALSTGF